MHILLFLPGIESPKPFTRRESKKQDHVRTSMDGESQRTICSNPSSEESAKKIKTLEGKGRKVSQGSDSGVAVLWDF